jgi:limonene-1,2-epoxide hydrolase
MNEALQSRAAVVKRLLAAVNDHDLDGVVASFADGYINETPAHPKRSFRGSDQVRTNWTQIFAGVPDLHAQIPRMAVDGETVWTEWEMAGSRVDGGAFAMCGVVIFGVNGATIASARFYLEPVEQTSGDVDAHTRRVVGHTELER